MKKKLTKRELEERTQRRKTLITRIVGFTLIAVMIFALCANLFIK